MTVVGRSLSQALSNQTITKGKVMEFFYLFLLCFTIGYVWVVYLIFKRNNKSDEVMLDLLDWLDEYKRRIGIGFFIGLFLIFVLCFKPLWKTTQCRYYQFSYNTVTKQDWMLSQCLYKTKTGAWLPLVVTRDSPGGEDQVNRPDDAVEVH